MPYGRIYRDIFDDDEDRCQNCLVRDGSIRKEVSPLELERDRETDRFASVAIIAVISLIMSPAIAAFLDGQIHRSQYGEYLTQHQKSEEPILSYRAYVDNHRKEHPILGRFYGIGGNR